jgi:hypothetical protein
MYDTIRKCHVQHSRYRPKKFVELAISYVGRFVTLRARGRTRDSPTHIGRIKGVRAMLVYLFRDENSRDTFAYSTDVTGRKIPRLSPYSQWSFVAAAKIQDLDTVEEVTRYLRQQGCYVFRRSRVP